MKKADFRVFFLLFMASVRSRPPGPPLVLLLYPPKRSGWCHSLLNFKTSWLPDPLTYLSAWTVFKSTSKFCRHVLVPLHTCWFQEVFSGYTFNTINSQEFANIVNSQEFALSYLLPRQMWQNTQVLPMISCKFSGFRQSTSVLLRKIPPWLWISPS